MMMLLMMIPGFQYHFIPVESCGIHFSPPLESAARQCGLLLLLRLPLLRVDGRCSCRNIIVSIDHITGVRAKEAFIIIIQLQAARLYRPLPWRATPLHDRHFPAGRP